MQNPKFKNINKGKYKIGDMVYLNIGLGNYKKYIYQIHSFDGIFYRLKSPNGFIGNGYMEANLVSIKYKKFWNTRLGRILWRYSE